MEKANLEAAFACFDSRKALEISGRFCGNLENIED